MKIFDAYGCCPRVVSIQLVVLIIATMLVIGNSSLSADKKPVKKREPRPFRWVNPPANELIGVKHSVFKSPSMKLDVGYCIYLPPGYDEQANQSRRYPVVYYLHGGRPGSESKSVRLASRFQQHIESGEIPLMIYVFVNGGPVSHYNLPKRENAMGEDVFIKELIPHIDKTYRTIADRKGRAIEGFSQGGRGTTRIMFKHPGLFCSAAPGGAGYATEKRISEENGRENENLVFEPGYNTWDLAREYAKHSRPKLSILIHVGTKGFNYENNLEYMEFLESLKIPFERLIVEGVPHSASQIYEKTGATIMKFHAANFRLEGALPAEKPKQFAFQQQSGKLMITYGGKPLASYEYENDKIARPYFAHVYAPNGVQVTRNHPPQKGDSTDHATMHPGIWMAFGDISGSDFWRNRARVEHERFEGEFNSNGESASFSVVNRYGAGDKVVCRQTCTYLFSQQPYGTLLIVDSTFHNDKAGFDFGAQEEMGLGVRVATPITVKAGGRILNSEQQLNEKQIWGKQADWCDYSGVVDGQRIGMALMPDPANFNRCWFHSRDYGVLVANPFGPRAGRKNRTPVKKGEDLRMRFGVLIHSSPSDQPIDLKHAYQAFLKQIK